MWQKFASHAVFVDNLIRTYQVTVVIFSPEISCKIFHTFVIFAINYLSVKVKRRLHRYNFVHIFIK